jgi:glycosyltransferase involved in cell wall biosynthesis
VVTVPPDVSVVAPAWNCEEYLPDLLHALESQTVPLDSFEVIIVDDGSTDRSREIVAAWAARDPEKRSLVPGEGKGPAHARNLGLHAARGEWVAFTDGDTIPDLDWLERGLDAVQRLSVHALEGAIYAGPDTLDPYAHKAFNVDGGMYMTGNMFVLRRLLLDVGGFDERFEVPSVEDRELAMRILAGGNAIPFVPEVRVRHRVFPQRPADVLRQTKRLSYIGLVWAKHPDMPDEDRAVFRVMNHVDIDILLTWLGLAGLGKTKGIGRLVLGLFVANGLRRAAGSGRVLDGPPREAPVRALIAMVLPVAKAVRCLQGSVRYRTFYW